MDYQYENMGEDRFQQICQSILAKEFPNLQCFPVKQPDGGRDAIAYIPSSGRSGREGSFIVFQVKYVRKPFAEAEPHKWLLNVLEDEAPKLSSLIPKGAKAYYLLTNVPGTAHPETGAIPWVAFQFSVLASHSRVPVNPNLKVGENERPG